MRIFNWIRNILCVVAVFVIIGAAACFIMKLKPATVMSGSMEPAFHVGSVVFVAKGREVKVGDPIAFEVGGNYVTHRITGEDGDTWITKGDANESEDPWRISKADGVDGKIILSIPYLGYLIHFMSTRKGIVTAVAIILCLVLSLFMAEDDEENETEEKEKKFKIKLPFGKKNAGEIYAAEDGMVSEIAEKTIEADAAGFGPAPDLMPIMMQKDNSEELRAKEARIAELEVQITTCKEAYRTLYKRHIDVMALFEKNGLVQAGATEKEKTYFPNPNV